MRRKPAEHFFFDLLPLFDPLGPYTYYETLPRIKQLSAFQGIADRILLSQYLTKRFAYSSFIQIGCEIEQVYSFLPETVTDRRCLDTASNPLNFFKTNQSKFGLILIDSGVMQIGSDVARDLADAALTSLDEDGILLLVNTNPAFKADLSKSLWGVAILLGDREDLEMATLDADGGISLIRPRLGGKTSKKEPAKGQEGDSAVTMAPPALTAPSPALTAAEREVQLHLMSLEELHEWLAPTGNVDAVTAFGGEQAVTLWRDQRLQREKCAAKTQTDTSDAVQCFTELVSSGKASLSTRAHLALLHLQRGHVVEAVPVLGDLQRLSPAWNERLWRSMSGDLQRKFSAAKESPDMIWYGPSGSKNASSP